MAATGSTGSAPARIKAMVAAGKHEVRRVPPTVREEDDTRNCALMIRTLAKRIGPDRSLRDAEAWWPLALRIGAAIEADVQAGEEDKQASRAVVWAVSDAIRACKRNGRCDHHACRAALAKLARTIRWRGAPAGSPSSSPPRPGIAPAG